MGHEQKSSAIIVGAGSGLSASFARKLASEGMELILAARNETKLGRAGRGDRRHHNQIAMPQSRKMSMRCSQRQTDSSEQQISFSTMPASGPRGDFESLDRDQVRKTLDVTAYGAFLVAQQAAQAMLRRGSGAIFFTGASASVKGYSKSAPFAMGKFALRGLAQSMARELSPKNIHVAHFVIDGGIGDSSDPRAASRGEDGLLHPDAIAESYWQVYRQHRSAWSWELELRPWAENF